MNENLAAEIRNALMIQKELYGDEILISREALNSGVSGELPRPAMPKIIETPTVKEPMPKYKTASAALPSLDQLKETVSSCKKCTLCKTRTQTVFGSGNPHALIMFVGEAPGADEDEQGLPFVGRAGQLLTKMIEEPRSLGLPRSEVYIANILKCRPPENRKPLPAEVEQCEPYLIAQIEQIKPKIIVALGATAANTLLKNNTPISAMRGQVFDYHGVPMLTTYHPAALLRNPNWKKPAWDDMITLREMYNKLKR